MNGLIAMIQSVAQYSVYYYQRVFLISKLRMTKIYHRQTHPYLEDPPTGKIIQNLEPGTYTVEEIKHPTSDENQLREDSTAEQECIIAGFPHGGGFLRNSASGTNYYFICLEYEDEQGDDCNTITLAAGESRTCTVKNYILFASIF